jgi:hypothetical protein
VSGVELGHELPSPVTQDVVHRHAVGHGKGQIEIRPAISTAVRKSADDGSGDDARIGRCQLEHAVADAVTVFDAEHAGILRFLPPMRH